MSSQNKRIVCYLVAVAGAVIRIRVTDSVVRVHVEAASVSAVVSIAALTEPAVAFCQSFADDNR